MIIRSRNFILDNIIGDIECKLLGLGLSKLI